MFVRVLALIFVCFVGAAKASAQSAPALLPNVFPNVAEVNEYGIPEIGVTLGRSDLNATFGTYFPSGNMGGSTFGIRPYFDIGQSFDTATPTGVHLSSEGGLSFDVGSPRAWLASVFTDIEAPLREDAQLSRAQLGTAFGLRAQYSWDLYSGGIEARFVAPLEFSGPAGTVDGYQTGGVRGTIWAEAELPLLRQFKLRAKVSAAFADQNYNRLNFGITANQAQDSRFAAYDPDAGFIHGSAEISGRYLFDRHWGIKATGQVKRYFGPAEDSPIIIEDGALQSQLDLTLFYRF